MGQVYEFEKEKLIIGVIYNDMEVYERAMAMLNEAFGEVDFESERFSFSKEGSKHAKKHRHIVYTPISMGKYRGNRGKWGKTIDH